MLHLPEALAVVANVADLCRHRFAGGLVLKRDAQVNQAELAQHDCDPSFCQRRKASWGWITPSPLVYSTTSVMTPDPTVLPPSRMAKWLPISRATGLSRLTATAALSPGMTMSMPSGRRISPV